jgi:hypothetical protein
MITTNTIETFAIGKRVQLHPALDRWMMGDRYGDIVKTTRTHVHVHLDRSGQTLRFLPMHLDPIN